MPARKKAIKLLTNKTCKEITDLLFGYLDNTLSRSVMRDFQRHLRVCPDCVSFLNTYKKPSQPPGRYAPTKCRRLFGRISWVFSASVSARTHSGHNDGGIFRPEVDSFGFATFHDRHSSKL